MHSRTWRTGIVSVVVTCSLTVGAVALASQESDASPVDRTTAVVTTPTQTAPVVADASGLDSIDTDARFSVAVLDLDTGESLTHGDGSFDTASIVKVDILAALLWQHQEAGTEPSATELSLAAAMIERSDNDAATTLFWAVGGEAGLQEFNEMIGLTSTDVGSDGNWGLTQTTADDQVRLLEVVLGDGSTLTQASQDLVRDLMSNVVDSQRFGVSAAADDADDAALKVGYLQRSTTSLWDVTSIGEVEAGGHTYLVAVLSDGNASLVAGTDLVEAVSQAAVGALG